MSRPVVAATALAAVALATATAAADPPPAPPPPRASLHLALVVGGTTAYIVSTTILEDPLTPDRCRWCASNDLDRGVRDALRWSDGTVASAISDFTAYGATPVVSVGLLFLAGHGDRRWLADGIAVAESAVAAALVTRAVKIAFGRRRPYVTGDGELAVGGNTSFFSGHTSFAFSVATSAATVASVRRDRLAPWIWASGVALASTAGYLRIAADRHWFTDVATGAAVGTAIGVAVPRLFHRHLRGDREVAVAVVPDGIVVGGAF